MLAGPKTKKGTPVVVAMLKAPRLGDVKTRLGSQIGREVATDLYRDLATHQVSSIPRDWRTEIYFSPVDAREEMQEWLGATHAYHSQCEGDLGQRLTHAVAGAFNRGASSVIVVGGDCPDLDQGCLRRAQEALQTVDVVLGPASDGGYYLIALRENHPQLFDRISWSTENVLNETLRRAAETGLRYALLEAKEDVDDLASLNRAFDRLPPLAANLRERLSPPLAG